MAGMLPPFVPPAARAPAESLPLITEFVLDPADRVAGAAPAGEAAAGAVSEPLVATEVVAQGEDWRDRGSFAAPEAEEILPSITEFVLEREPVGGREEAPTPAVAEVVAEEPAPVEMPAAVAPVEAAVPEMVPEPAAEPEAEVAANGWVTEERDAFDWSGLARLTPESDEERRAADDWSRTEWQVPASAATERAAQALMQLARRIRAGELQVEIERDMSPEAVLASVLATLLGAQQKHPR